MAFSCNSLGAFLTHAKAALHSATHHAQKITLVIGNESADLDSLTSSLLYAYVRSCSPPRNAFTSLYIPVTNIPAADIRLRPEFLAVCLHANIETRHLITLDDLPPFVELKQRLTPENTTWILVDHNKLQGVLGEIYTSGARGVIDHHDEEHAVRQHTDPEPRIIEQSGSCTSLVVRYCRDTWDQLSSSSLSTGAAHAQSDSLVDDSAVRWVWDAQIAKLALASILIDTANLTAKGKVEHVDIQAVDYLETKIDLSPRDAVSYNRQNYYDEINTAKKDIDTLDLGDILRKDYKEWNEAGKKLGISSVVKPIDWLLRKTGDQKSFLHTAQNFSEKRGLSICAIMTASTNQNGHFQRELFLWALDASSIPAAQKFAETANTELGLEEQMALGIQERSADMWRRLWVQKEVGKSRKQVAPLLRDSMKG
ncbi:MAG: Exopolyphosphatase [Pleopsidium flavum]|nr:MAG: Exopolyphosphatase [Pleopsidium flavum]